MSPPVPDFDRIAWKADHSLDEVRVLGRVAEDDDVAAVRQGANDSRPLNGGKPKGKL